MSPGQEALRVGELARRTGLTIRALHHYDEIGLLTPRRTPSGHRLYAAAEIARLQRIRSLQMLGFGLEKIREFLDDPDLSPVQVLDMHIDGLRKEAAEVERLRARLERLRSHLNKAGDIPVGEFLEAIEEISMFEKYYNKQQLLQLESRAQELGEEAIRAVESEWPLLIADMRGKMDAGIDPADPEVKILAKRWQELIDMFTAGDAGIRQSLSNMYRTEPGMAADKGLGEGIGNYVRRALDESN